MSNNPGKDPPQTDIASLQESFSKQQAKIEALKKLVKRTEDDHSKSASSTHEKVKTIAQRLTHIKSKARYRQQQDRSFSEFRDSPIMEESVTRDEVLLTSTPKRQMSVPQCSEEKGRHMDVGSSEKFQLLRQQMEESKLKMAERENSKREIEELVTQLKAKFDSTQQSLERSSELGRSMGDLSILSDTPIREKYKSAADLSSTPFNLEKEKIKFLENRVRHLEKQLEQEREIEMEEKEKEKMKSLENKILDLEESLREKECIIEARTQAVCLMTENLSLKGKNTVDLLEDTKVEMCKMQTTFVETEDCLKAEIQQLKEDLEQKDMKIKNLEEVNDILETARFDLTIKNAESESKIQNVQEYSTKLSELNKLNESLQHRISDLENQRQELILNDEIDVTKQLNKEYVNKIQLLEKRISSLEVENDELKKMVQDSQVIPSAEVTEETIAEKIRLLEAAIQTQLEQLENQQSTINQLEEQVAEKTVEYNVLNANFSVLHEKLKASAPKSLFLTSSDEEAQIEINRLKGLLAENNKSMIKMKLKIKQQQKQVDRFQKISDANAELVRLGDENCCLQQKVAELEEEKGSLQLKLVSGDSNVLETDELVEKVQILETTCQNQTTAIQLLEEQKIDMTENLESAKQQLEVLRDHVKEIDLEETDRVSTQIKTVQLEEQFDNSLTQIEELKLEIEDLKRQVESLKEEIHNLEQDKEELNKKVHHYISENMELLDKIEKLNKSSSSAESIEIVEGLTHQEKLEIEAFNKKCAEQHASNVSVPENSSELVTGGGEEQLVEGIAKFRTNRPELVHLELLEKERREVFEKMDLLSTDNQQLILKIQELLKEKDTLEENYKKLQTDKCKYEEKLVSEIRAKDELSQSVKEFAENKRKLENELNVLRKEKRSLNNAVSPVVESVASNSISLESLTASEKILERLNNEIENYRKSTDKNSKLNSSRKLVKEATNAYKQMSSFIKEMKSTIEAAKEIVPNESELTVHDEYQIDIETVRLKCIEMEGLFDIVEKEMETNAIELKTLRDEHENQRTELNDLKESFELLTETTDSAEKTHQIEKNELERVRRELEAKLKTTEAEVGILKSLVAEQKGQLIELYTEHESDMSKEFEKLSAYEKKIESLTNELKTLQGQKTETYDDYAKKLEMEIKELKNLLISNDQLLKEQANDLKNKQDTIESLNAQIMELYKNMEDNSSKIIQKDDELLYLKKLLNTNKAEFEKLNKEIVENRSIIARLRQETKEAKNIDVQQQYELQAEVQMLKDELTYADTMKSELEHKNKEQLEKLKKLKDELIYADTIKSELEHKNKEQLEKLKKLAANLKKKVAQSNEFEEKIKELKKINLPIEGPATITINADQELKLKDLENRLIIYQDEIDALKLATEQAKLQFEENLQKLQNENELLQDERYTLQQNLNESKANLERLVQEFSRKQEDLSEYQQYKEMYHQLEIQMSETQFEKSELMQKINKLASEIEEKNMQLESHSEELKTKSLKFERCKVTLKEKLRDIQRLTVERDNLAQQMQKRTEETESDSASLKVKYDELVQSHEQLTNTFEKERAAFRETITRLEMLHDSIQAKLQEDMGYIESLETENNKFKEKIFRLEECVALFEERRSSLERQANLLDEQLQCKTDEYEKNEDALIHRLNMLSEHDNIIGRKLLANQEQNEELVEKINRLKSDNSELQSKNSKLELEFEGFRTEKFDCLEAENQSLIEQLNNSKHEAIKLKASFEERLAKKHAEIDELENELSVQLQKIESEKRSLQENLEKSVDEIVELKDELVRIKENSHALEQIKNDMEREMTWIKMQNESMAQDQIELQQLRVQIIQDKTELENQKHQIETLIQNHEIELNALRTQIDELDSMRMQVGQNQTDDQVFIETENKKLKELIAKKDAAIENYQRENLKLQMAATAHSSSVSGSFGIFENVVAQTQTVQSSSEIAATRDRLEATEKELYELQNLIQNKNEEIAAFKQEQADLRLEIQQLNTNNSNLQKLCLERQSEIKTMKEEITISRSSNIPLAAAKPPTNSDQSVTNKSSEPAFPLFQISHQSSSNIFDEIVTARHVGTLEEGNTEQERKKIEDLQRNVSDLEKYVAELETQLSQMRNLYEETLMQLQRQTQTYEQSFEEYREHMQMLQAQEHEKQIQRDIESLILPTQHGKVSAKSQPPSLNMFFGSPEENVQDFDALLQPQQIESESQTDGAVVTEEMIVPRKAYLCYEDTETAAGANAEAGGEAWYWGADEAILEEKHQMTNSTHQQSYGLEPSSSSLETKVREYQMRCAELELERNRMEEKVVEGQVLAGKLKKKLKEYRTKIDQLSASQNVFQKSSSVESNDLDIAIQEELKSQVKTLEERLNELRQQNEKAIAEKENLLKRVDVLTAANERMIEMKERQDIENQSYQAQIRQLNQELSSLKDWGENTVGNVSGASHIHNTTSSVQKQTSNMEEQIKELNHELEDVRADREELQALLDDERESGRINEAKIKELQNKLVNLENNISDNKASGEEVEKLLRRIEQIENENSNLISQSSNKETDLSNMKLRNQNLQMQLNDYQSTVEQLSKESQSITAHLEQLKQDHQKKVFENSSLSKELDQWVTKSNELSREIADMKSEAKSRCEMDEDRTKIEAKLEDMSGQLHYKDNEIQLLRRKLEEMSRDDQTQSLVQEILVKNQEIQSLRETVKELEQITKEMSYKKDESSSTEELLSQIRVLEETVKELRTEKESMEVEMQVLDKHVLSSIDIEDRMKETVLELDMKNIEIQELKNSLEVLKEQQQNCEQIGETQQIITTEDQLQQINVQWKAIVEQRCGEIAEGWRQHMIQKESEFKQVESDLRQQIDEWQNKLDAVTESGANTNDIITNEEGIDVPVNEDNETIDLNMVKNMQSALENQELEIVTLKEQLAIRSAEYARLASQHDPYGQVTSSSITLPPRAQKKLSSGSTTGATNIGANTGGIIRADPIPTQSKSELDLALYMLHQRDMRCEELTLELYSLLEERDTLQLKLSNTIRQMEEIKQKTGYTESGSDSDQAASNTNSPEKTRPSTGMATDEEYVRTTDKLNAKLSEIHQISHGREKRHWDDRDQHHRQFENIQEDLANIPSEAVSELVGSNLRTNASQSTPSALLNWLLGKTDSSTSHQS